MKYEFNSTLPPHQRILSMRKLKHFIQPNALQNSHTLNRSTLVIGFRDRIIYKLNEPQNAFIPILFAPKIQPFKSHSLGLHSTDKHIYQH